MKRADEGVKDDAPRLVGCALVIGPAETNPSPGVQALADQRMIF